MLPGDATLIYVCMEENVGLLGLVEVEILEQDVVGNICNNFQLHLKASNTFKKIKYKKGLENQINTTSFCSLEMDYSKCLNLKPKQWIGISKDVLPNGKKKFKKYNNLIIRCKFNSVFALVD